MTTTDHDVVAAHLLWCRRRNLAESTIYQRGRALARAQARLAGVSLLDADTELLERGMDAERWQSCSRAAEVSHLRAFYRWAAWAGHRGDDPSIDLVRPKVPRGLPRPIADDVLGQALELADRPIRTILLLAALAGLRAREIAPLRAEHVLLDLNVLLVAEAKGGDAQAVALHPLLAAELTEVMPTSGWLFPRLDGHPGPWKAWSICGRTNTFLHDVVGTAHTLHTLRHWYGTKVLTAAGGNVRVAQLALRHRSVVSTSIYTWIAPTDVATAIGDLPDPHGEAA